MSQHDLDLANAAGASFRSDLNNALVALGTLQSGASAPSTTFPYMLWADTTNGLLKQRNAANSGWIVRGALAESFVLSRSSNTILAGADLGKTIIATAGFTQTLTAAATLGDGWFCDYNAQGYSIVLDPNGSETIDGATTKTVTGSGRIYCNGSAFFTIGFPAASASGFYAPGASVGSNALTVTLPAGTVCSFNDGTSVTLGSTLSLTVSSGSTLGTVSGTPSCIWVAVVKNSGTPELAVRNNVSYVAADALSIAGFSMSESISTTAEGGAGGADSAQTWYSTTSRSSQPWAPVGFVLSTQTTAGTWAQTVTAVGFGPGTALPGAVIGFTRKETGALVSGSTSIPFDDTIPQSTEGVLTLTATHNRRLAAGVMEIRANVQAVESANTADLFVVAMFQDSTANAIKAASCSVSSAESSPISTPISHVMVSGATGNTDIKIRCGLNAAVQIDVNGIGGVRRLAGVYDTSITIKEYQP